MCVSIIHVYHLKTSREREWVSIIPVYFRDEDRERVLIILVYHFGTRRESMFQSYLSIPSGRGERVCFNHTCLVPQDEDRECISIIPVHYLRKRIECISIIPVHYLRKRIEGVFESCLSITSGRGERVFQPYTSGRG